MMIGNSRGTALCFTLLVAVLLLGGCAARPVQNGVVADPDQKLIELMGRRLEVVRHLVWVKFQNDGSVGGDDRLWLDPMEGKGVALGQDPEGGRRFLLAQSRAARALESESLTRWERGGVLPAYAPWDPKRHIQPKLEEVTEEMLAAFGAKSGDRDRLVTAAKRHLREKGFSRRVADMAAAGLR